MRLQQVKKPLKKALITLFWIGLWQLLSAATGLSVLLPSPLETLESLSMLLTQAEFYKSVAFSLLRISIGFIIGVLLGGVSGFVSSFSSLVFSVLSPMVQIIKATPVASFIVLAVVWLKTGNVPSFTTTLIVFPIIFMNVKTGAQETDGKLIEMANAFRVSRLKKIQKIYLPSVMPYFISACTTAMGLAWKAGVAAEVICNPRTSIGSGIYSSKIYLDTPSLFAWTSVVIVMSILLERLMLLLLKRIGKNDKAQ